MIFIVLSYTVISYMREFTRTLKATVSQCHNALITEKIWQKKYCAPYSGWLPSIKPSCSKTELNRCTRTKISLKNDENVLLLQLTGDDGFQPVDDESVGRRSSRHCGRDVERTGLFSEATPPQTAAPPLHSKRRLLTTAKQATLFAA